ncbi:MAG: NAD(P)H-hydrate dehydratase [Pseudohongiellaceae bacterium]
MADFTTRLPRALYLAEQVRELDRLAIERFDIPGFTLMQAAGAAAFTLLRETWPQVQRLVVFAGSGNNAGDGFIIARLGAEAGLQVSIIQVGNTDNLQGAAAEAHARAVDKGVPMLTLAELRAAPQHDSPNTVAVDALLGTGLDRQVAGDYASAIELLNERDWPVLAVDIPSGLAADTGQPLGSAVVAEVTVTFIGMKFGLLTGRAREFAGRVYFDSLDVPEGVHTGDDSPRPVARRIDINDTARYLPARRAASHKGDNGHVLVLGGDHRYGGAVIMAAEAAARAGAGLVSVLTRSAHREAALARRPELMVMGTEDSDRQPAVLLAKADAIVIGPGLGRDAWARELLQLALAEQRARGIPLVLDADALHLLAERADANAPTKRDNWILTPHPGEAAVLLGSDAAAIQADRLAAVSALAAKWGGACLLKGSGSLIAGPGEARPLFLCSEGNPGMGTGGMGDILSGVVGALLAQGLALTEALCCAVCIHGEAADLAAAEGGERGLLATDLLPHIRELVNLPDSVQS